MRVILVHNPRHGDPDPRERGYNDGGRLYREEYRNLIIGKKGGNM